MSYLHLDSAVFLQTQVKTTVFNVHQLNLIKIFSKSLFHDNYETPQTPENLNFALISKTCLDLNPTMC